MSTRIAQERLRIRNLWEAAEEFAGTDEEEPSYLNLLHMRWMSECLHRPPDDSSDELCMQPVTCCLSVSKPVKGELIIPAGWFPEASVAPGVRTPLPGFLMDTLITLEAD